MHVLHSESTKFLGGQTLRLVREARCLEERGWSCTIVGTEGSPFEAHARGLASFVPFRFGRGLRASAAVLRARALLAKLCPDVVHTHSSPDAWCFGLAARSLGLPIVRGRHISKPIPRSPLGRIAFTHLADAVTASGETIRRLVVESGAQDASRVFVTPTSLDLRRFDARLRDPGFLRRELALPDGARLVGCVCNVRVQKGVQTLLRAFGAVLEGGRCGDVHLVHAGGGDVETLRELLAPLGPRAHLLGFRHDVERVIGGLDLLVLSAERDDGVPQVVPQAMALGVPVIGSRSGGIPDVVVEGETGFLVPPGDARALARRIEAFLTGELVATPALLERAAALVAREHTVEAVVEQYLRAYALVLARRSRAWQGAPSAR